MLQSSSYRMRIGSAVPSARRSPVAALAMALLACALSAAIGCSWSLPHPQYVAQTTSALTAVDLPPPPGRVEAIPPMPPGAVWVDGEWLWRRARWAWSPGRWVVAPAGATFSPWAFTRAPDGTLWYAPAAWHDAKGAAIEAPAPIALAHCDTVEVVNASGDVESTGPTLRSRARPGQ